MANIAIDADTSVTNAWCKIPAVTAINADATVFIPQLLSCYPQNLEASQIFVFADPPYLNEVRATKKAYYKNEMQDHVTHENMLAAFQKLKCNVLITHYPCELYDQTLSSWRKIDIKGRTRQGIRIERLYMNYEEPTELHDYRYFGNTFRQREAYKRAKQNMISKFDKMSDIEKKYFKNVLFNNPFL